MAEPLNVDNLEGLRQEAERGYKMTRYQRAVRNAAPALLAEVRQLREDKERLRGLLRQVQTRVADTEDVGDIAGMFWVSGLDERIKEALGSVEEGQ